MVVCPTALVVVCSSGLVIACSTSLVVVCPTGLTVNDIEGEEDVSGRTGHCDEFCGSRSGERRAEDALGGVSH